MKAIGSLFPVVFLLLCSGLQSKGLSKHDDNASLIVMIAWHIDFVQYICCCFYNVDGAAGANRLRPLLRRGIDKDEASGCSLHKHCHIHRNLYLRVGLGHRKVGHWMVEVFQ